MPGPGARTFRAKTMRQLPFHGPGGPTVRAPNARCSCRVGATGRSPDQPASSCGSRSTPLGRGPARPMLFARKLIAPGHNPSIPEMSTLNSLPAEPGIYHKEIYYSRKSIFQCPLPDDTLKLPFPSPSARLLPTKSPRTWRKLCHRAKESWFPWDGAS